MRKYSILLVDDDHFVLNGIGKYLSNKGYEVVTADSGEKGAGLLDEMSFDMVITDLAMGEMDGIGVLKKTKEVSPDTMVVILTGYGNLSSAIDAIRFDADVYILKPCEPLKIGITVSRCFEKYELALKIKSYENILPVCCVCKKIRDDQGYWKQIESYIQDHAEALFSHSICQECAKEHYPDLDIYDE